MPTMMRSLQCLFAASLLNASRVVAAGLVEGPVKKRVVSYGTEGEKKRDLHEWEGGEHWHEDELEDMQNYYYIHDIEGWESLSMSLPTMPPKPHPPTNKGKGYKGKGMGKGKGVSSSKGKMMKSSKSKGKGMKKSGKKGKKSHHDGYYWYEHEHAPEGYWYYYEHEHEHDDGHHGGDHEYYEYNKGKGGHSMKSMGMKSMGMGKGKGKGIPTIPPPRFPTMTPTLSPTSSPTLPVPTMPPTEPGPSVMADPFTLTYTLGTAGTPDDLMLSELTLVTQGYIDEFHRNAYEGSPVIFDRAETTFVNFTSPNQVDFETTFFFMPAAQVPSATELNTGMALIFDGAPLQDYIDRLVRLPSPNVFRGTTDVDFQTTSEVTRSVDTTPADGASAGDGTTATAVPPMPTFDTPTARSSDGGSGAGILAAAGAGAFVLVVAGYVMYRRSTEEVELAGKFIDPDGHMTVTGETYVGGQSMEDSTYAGGQSADAESTSPSQPPTSYRSETPEWKEYHDGEQAMMTESEWEEYQETLEQNRTIDSPFEAIPEEQEEEGETKLPYGEDDDSFPKRILSELDDVTL